MQCDDPQSSLQCDDPQSSISLALEMLCVLGGYANRKSVAGARIRDWYSPVRDEYTTPHTSTHRVCLDRHRISAPDGYISSQGSSPHTHPFNGVSEPYSKKISSPLRMARVATRMGCAGRSTQTCRLHGRLPTLFTNSRWELYLRLHRGSLAMQATP